MALTLPRTPAPWAVQPPLEPKHPGPDGTIGEMLKYSRAMQDVQHRRPGFLPQGTRVTLRDGRKATINHFVPYDGYNIGVTIIGVPNEGVITIRADLAQDPAQGKVGGK